MSHLNYRPNFIEPSAEELAEIAEALEQLRRQAWGEWLATEPVIDLDDEDAFALTRLP